MLRAVPDDSVHPVRRDAYELLQVRSVLYFVDQHDQGHLIPPLQQLLVAVVVYPDEMVPEIRNPFPDLADCADTVPQMHVSRPRGLPLIVYDRDDHRIAEAFPPGVPLPAPFHLPAVFRPDAHHVAEQLHGHIVVHPALVLNQGDEERRLVAAPPLFPSDVKDPNLLHGVRLKFRAQVGDIPL